MSIISPKDRTKMFHQLKAIFPITRKEFDYFYSLGGRVNKMITQLNKSGQLIEPMHLYSRGIGRFETRKQFENRIEYWKELLFNPMLITERNKLTDERMYQFFDQVAETKKGYNRLKKYYDSMSLKEKQSFLSNNDDIRSFLVPSDYEESENKDSPFDFTTDRVIGRMIYTRRKLKRLAK